MGKPIRRILRSVVQQNSETTGIQRIVLVGLAHALFRFVGIGKVRTVAGTFHFVNDPIPMACGFHGDLTTRWKRIKKGTDTSNRDVLSILGEYLEANAAVSMKFGL